MGSKNRVEHKLHITKNKTSQLQLLADSVGKSTQSLIARLVKSVCEHGFYHYQFSHDKELMNRLETVAETHRMARSELVLYAVMDMVRRLELEQSSHNSLWSSDSVDILPRPKETGFFALLDKSKPYHLGLFKKISICAIAS